MTKKTKIYQTRYGYYFIENCKYVVIFDDKKRDFLCKHEIIDYMRTMFLFNGKRKIN